jgi:hypothetical protein
MFNPSSPFQGYEFKREVGAYADHNLSADFARLGEVIELRFEKLGRNSKFLEYICEGMFISRP